MKERNLLPPNQNSDNRGRLLRQQLAENEQKMALLNHEQAQKQAELTRVQQELNELAKQYPGYKHKM